MEVTVFKKKAITKRISGENEEYRDFPDTQGKKGRY